MTERVGVEQDELRHDSVILLEQGPMGTHLVDSPHPLLIGWLVRAVWDLGDLSESTPRRFKLLAALLFGELEKPAVRSQGRWREGGVALHGIRFRGLHEVLRS